MQRWKLAALAAAVFGAGYLVYRVADWIAYSDEERIADRFREMARAAAAEEYSRLPEFVRLADFGFVAAGYGRRHVFAAGDEPKVIDRAVEAAAWVRIRTMRTTVSEDDVHVRDGHADVRTVLAFDEADGRTMRQPVRALFRKAGDRWFLVEFELERPEDVLRF